MKLTIVSRLEDQPSIGPIGVVDQSIARIRSPISPPPCMKLEAAPDTSRRTGRSGLTVPTLPRSSFIDPTALAGPLEWSQAAVCKGQNELKARAQTSPE